MQGGRVIVRGRSHVPCLKAQGNSARLDSNSQEASKSNSSRKAPVLRSILQHATK